MVEYENEDLIIAHKGEICDKPLTLTVTRIVHSGGYEGSPIYQITGTIHLKSTLDVIVICRKEEKNSQRVGFLRRLRKQKNPIHRGTKEVLEKLIRNLQSVKPDTQSMEEEEINRIAIKISKPTYSASQKNVDQPSPL